MTGSTDGPPRRYDFWWRLSPARADRIGLVLLGWHGVLVVGFVGWAARPWQSPAVSCGGRPGSCAGRQLGVAVAALLGLALLVVSLVVAAVAAWRLARDPARSPLAVGTRAAWTGILLTAGAALVLGLLLAGAAP